MSTPPSRHGEPLATSPKSMSSVTATRAAALALAHDGTSVSNPSALRRASSEAVLGKTGHAALFGALKFKGLLNLRLRARRARLGTLGPGEARSRRPSLAKQELSGSRGSDYGSMLGNGSERATPGLTVQTDAIAGDVSREEDMSLRSDFLAVRDLVLGSKVNAFLLLIPFGALAEAHEWGDTAVFSLNFFAILPLAQLLGDFTEEVALYTNDTIGGLLNATLGNATELIISVFAIQKGLLRVVQVSLLGSVLSNELLVTGCCFLFGGLYHKEQHFNSHIAAIDSSLLLMAVLGLTIPAAFSSTVRNDCAVPCRVDSIAEISHITALLLFFLYGMLLVFQLKTHTHLMDAAHGSEGGKAVAPDDDGANDADAAAARQPLFAVAGTAAVRSHELLLSCHSGSSSLEDEQDPEEATMSLRMAVAMLGVTTLLVAWCSELLVGSIEEVSLAWGLSEVFIGMILLPIIGNAAEHATAITVAIKGKMDLALGVALGSSVQIALCVVPALCLVGWAMDKPLTLDFHPFETIVLVVSVLVVTSTVRQGTSTWLEGVMLIISYVIVSLAYYYRREPPEGAGATPACVCGEACCSTV